MATMIEQVAGESVKPAYGRSLMQAIAGKAPRQLVEIEAELLFMSGQYLLHYMKDGANEYKLLTPAALRQAFAGEPVDSGWLSPSIVRWGEGGGGQFVVCWIAPGLHTILVDGVAIEGRRRKRKNSVESLTVPLPGLVLLGVGRAWYVWAISSDTFDYLAVAYYPPLPNIMNTGAVCWGSNVPPLACPSTVEEAWRLFLSTPFNADMSARRSRLFPNDVRGHLSVLAAEQATTFPAEKTLIPFDNNRVVGHVVDTLVRGSAR